MRFCLWLIVLAVVSAPALAQVPDSGGLVDREPRPILVVPAVYPDSARAVRLEGRVFVRVLVGITGEVRHAQVFESSHSVFDSSAVQAVRQWRFYPASLGGRVVERWVTVPVRFRLGGPLVAEDPPGAPQRPEHPVLLAFGPGLRANPDGCTEAFAAQPRHTPMPDYRPVRDRVGSDTRTEMLTRAWVEVEEDGAVASVVLMETEGRRNAIAVFERAVEKSLLDWRFVPASCNGRAVRSWYLVPMRYRQ